ncbi:EAL domain-containing protein [Azovibrio restrictus]|uniref:EAL domain-containing protein n=1 Tax=Azovibrio restrictus TaxID=146938 RepID=UPI0026EAC6F0|nr:EAL domain-containing protein [Azovibrio restrictus]MDD3483210.1 EAL domain-containing protein [Azovibrio restrictus]
MNARLPLAPSSINAYQLHPHEILEIAVQGRCGVEYQPLVSASTERIIGYEALARFYRYEGSPIAPDTLFERLHVEPLLLYHLELSAKRIQLQHAPEEGLLFINLDPDSYDQGEKDHPGGNTFLDLFEDCGIKERLVIEIIENLAVRDVVLSRRMIDTLSGHELKVAMDDLAVSKGLISFGSLADATYLKFDLSWLAEQGQPRREEILRWSLSAAHAMSVMTVLEGVETEADLEFARKHGFDLVQGFRYREHFRHWHPEQS